MKKSIVTIAGTLGSGKSSTARSVAVKLGYKHYSSGDLFRQMAAERNESVEMTNISAETQKDLDFRVDDWLQHLYRTENEFIVDSRMAWHWMPESFKVFLALDPDTAAARIFMQIQSGGRVSEHEESLQDVRDSIERRLVSEQKRYSDLYGVNPRDPKNFDLVIDTKSNNLDAVVELVLRGYEQWRSA